MEIRLCWIPTNLHLMVISSPLVQLARCSRKQRFGFTVIALLLVSAVLISVHTLPKKEQYFTAKEYPDQERFLQHRRKSVYSNYKTRNVRISTDYSDPVLVDMLVKNSKMAKLDEQQENLSVSDFSYGVVIDCGSSGSRIFVYYWPKHSGHPNELLKIRQLLVDGNPVVKKINPGLATNANKPQAVAAYLKPLLEYGSLHVPVEKQSETPLYVLCTAGMRMLTKRLQASILEQVQIAVHRHSNFQFLSSHAEVISGMTEGLYFWMGLNYVLGNLHQVPHNLPDSQHHVIASNNNENVKGFRPPTVGVIDMGGASMQIAYEVNQEGSASYLNQIIEVNLGCDQHKSAHEYKVFVDTFLHKGGNAVRSTYERDVLLNLMAKNKTTSSTIVLDPCLPVGFTQEISYSARNGLKVTRTLNGTGNYQECRQRVLSYVDKSGCDNISHNCILNGRKMPLINYTQDKFFGSSEFFYCMDDVLSIGGLYEKALFEKKAAEYCATPWDITWQKHMDGYYKSADVSRLKFQCFKSAWVSVVLHEGLNFPSNYKHFTSVKYINKSEIQWTLGAILYKTRFLPLREIQVQYQQAKINADEKVGGLFQFFNDAFLVMAHSSFFLIMCITIVAIYVLIAFIRFCLHLDRRKVASLRRVGSSVAYFVHEEV